ncbi:hypothetical protein DRQ09_03005 [candidate division KSB1 bacterium]|nr:MAG: hypothetical protein DRQ09_03005 [candidate division KSB1 bacterium]
MNPEEFYRIFKNKLNRLKRGELLNSFSLSFLTFLIFISAVLFLTITIELVFHLSPENRRLLIYVSSFILFSIAIVIFSGPLKGLFGFDKNLSYRNLCLKVGRRFPEIKDRLLNALQVYENRLSNKEGYSGELISKAIVEAGKDYISLDFNSVIDYRRLKNRGSIFLICFTGLFIISMIFYSSFKDSFIRISHPGKEFPVPLPFSITVSPGNKEIIRGESVEITADITGKTPDEVVIYLNYDKNEKPKKRELKKIRKNKYIVHIDNIRDSFTYFAYGLKRGGFLKKFEVVTGEYRINVIQPPVIKKIKVKLDYPEYSGLGSRYLEDNIGDITTLKGTKVTVEISSNKIINDGKIIFNDGTFSKMQVSGIKARGKFIVYDDKRYHLEICDDKGIKNKKPIEYWITALKDEYPFIRIEEPGQDTDIDESMKLPLMMKISDDFGFSGMKLNYIRVDRKLDSLNIKNINFSRLDIELKDKSPQLKEVFYEWDLSNLNLLPEDVVMYFVEVFDNDAVSGPKVSKSSAYTLRFPSIFEIFSEIENRQNEKIGELDDIVKESREIKEKIDKIVLDLKRSSTINWENKKGLEESLRKTEEIRKKLEQIRKELEDITSTLEKNSLFSPEVMKKYLELQKLFQEIVTPELKTAMEKLRKAIEQMDPKKTKQAIEQFKISQENFLKRIERTTNILRQIQIEQKMDEAIKKSEKLIELQKNINETLNKLKTENKTPEKSLSSRERKLAENTSDFQRTLEDLLGKMSQNLDMPYEKVGNIIEDAKKMELNNRMIDMSKQIELSNVNLALKSGIGIQRDLKSLNNQLKSAKDDMVSGQKNRIMTVMKKSESDLLILSRNQEFLTKQTRSLFQNSPQFPDVAEKQNEVLSGLSRITKNLVELSQKTFFVTPEIGRAIGGALKNIGQSLRFLEERNGQGASRAQGTALSYLNESIVELRKSIRALSKAGSATGLEEYIKRLEQMAGAQQGINKQTAELPLGKSYTKMQMEMLRKLAAEQEMLRKSLQELYKEMGRRSEIPGRLDGIGKTMDEVIKDLKSANINERTLKLQERILSRLLDAQRSVRTKDYSRKRKSQVGKEYKTTSPGDIPFDILYKKDKLKENLMRALEEGYTKDYLELIRKYFEALSKFKSEEVKN